MDVAELRPLPIFDSLTNTQLGELAADGDEVSIEPGVDLFREGAPADFWWVLVDGSIDLVRHIGREDVVVAKMHEPGRWAGGFRAWDEHGVYLATGRGLAPGRALRVPSEVLRERAEVWFPFAGHLIEGLYRTARTIESTARQRDALVTLGTLAAGLAHEINNPASAATRSVDALAVASQTLLSSLRRLADDEITPTQFAALDALRLEVRPEDADPDALARSDREQAIAAWGSRRGIDDAWTIIPPLAADGVDVGWCDRVAAVVEGPALRAGLEWLASTFTATTLLSEVKESTRRISDVVAAVRSYSQLDRGSMQEVEVSEGLDSTVVVLAHKLGTGVRVVREYSADVPRIQAYAGELNQVWTNLIDNAIDAMDGQGTVRLVTRVDGADLVVEVCDSGPGMPPEVVGRAFEAFYTTKDVGKGTGLGLDIAQRIVVERHGGAIRIDRRGDETVIEVRIPMHARPASEQ